MTPEKQIILPAARQIKDLEKLLAREFETIVILDTHIGQLQPIVQLAKSHGKKPLLHADLIGGLKNDEEAAEYLCQVIRPAGIISTRAGVIAKTKQNGIVAIQRLFMLDTNALEKSYALLRKTEPDYIEVLPGVIPHMIREVHARTGIPVIAGGLVRTTNEVQQAIEAGAVAVTTSRKDLWDHFETKQR